MQPFLRLAQVAKWFDPNRPVLKAINLDVAAETVTAILGPSGCGKTTLLRLIAGLESPNAGTIEIAGIRCNNVPPWQRGVAFAFQRPAMLPGRKVRTHLAETGATQNDLGRVIEWLELGAVLERQPHQLSGGEQQRVALARTFLRRTRLLFLDEPLAHVDAPLKRKIWRDLGLLRRTFPATMLYVTHDAEEAAAVADRIAILLQGAIVQEDTLYNLRRAPANSYVRDVFAAFERL